MSELRSTDKPNGSQGKERMRLGLHHRLRDSGSHSARIAYVDLRILLFCLGVYGFGHLLHQAWPLPSVARAYIFDLFAVPALLAWSNILTALSPLRQPVFASVTAGGCLGALAVIEWEVIAPLYTSSTPDPLDVLAYCIGGVAYLWYRRRPAEELSCGAHERLRTARSARQTLSQRAPSA